MQVQAGGVGLVAEREDDLVPADAEIEKEIVGDLAGPQSLHNVSWLNLFPARVFRDELVRRVAPEEAVLFVIKPDEAEFVLGVDLSIAAEVCVGLVIYVDDGVVRLISYRENALPEVITTIGAK